jgi:hypothetical protein
MDAHWLDQYTPEERLVAEQAILNFRELNKTCDEAADGTVLDVCETLAIQQGRELIRKTVETSLSLQAREVEKKGRARGRVTAEKPSATPDARPGN